MSPQRSGGSTGSANSGAAEVEPRPGHAARSSSSARSASASEERERAGLPPVDEPGGSRPVDVDTGRTGRTTGCARQTPGGGGTSGPNVSGASPWHARQSVLWAFQITRSAQGSDRQALHNLRCSEKSSVNQWISTSSSAASARVQYRGYLGPAAQARTARDIGAAVLHVGAHSEPARILRASAYRSRRAPRGTRAPVSHDHRVVVPTPRDRCQFARRDTSGLTDIARLHGGGQGDPTRCENLAQRVKS